MYPASGVQSAGVFSSPWHQRHRSDLAISKSRVSKGITWCEEKHVSYPQDSFRASWRSAAGEQGEGNVHVAVIHQQSALARGVPRGRNPGWTWVLAHSSLSGEASSKILGETPRPLLLSLSLGKQPEHWAAQCLATEALHKANAGPW